MAKFIVVDSPTKGLRVVVTGRLRPHHWENEQGEKRSMFQLDVDEIGPSLNWATFRRMFTKSGGAWEVDPGAG
jgi:single-strand DNA-binding protein